RRTVRVCPECVAGEDELTTLPLSAGKQSVPVCGRSPHEAARALELAHVVSERRLPATGRESRADLPVDDHALAVVVETLYGNAPRAVAEAVRALRKLGDGGADWLLRVLQVRDSLRPLAAKVNTELGDPTAWPGAFAPCRRGLGGV